MIPSRGKIESLKRVGRTAWIGVGHEETSKTKAESVVAVYAERPIARSGDRYDGRRFVADAVGAAGPTRVVKQSAGPTQSQRAVRGHKNGNGRVAADQSRYRDILGESVRNVRVLLGKLRSKR